jgi:DNA-3-methyladenine glycosylase II
MQPVTVEPTGPYDLQLSLRAARSFAPSDPARPEDTLSALRSVVRLDGVPFLLEVRQVNAEPPLLEAEIQLGDAAAADRTQPSPGSVESMAARLVNADLDLRAFYDLAVNHPFMGPLTRELHGLKAFRPSTLFEMLVIAVIEQQISLIAAYRIRERLVQRFGDAVDGLTAFPTPASLAETPLEGLMECGVSRRKAEYIGGLAELLETGTVDIESWAQLSDDDVREAVTAIRGFGRWSADYLLVRGLGRADVAPADDLGIQTLLGKILGEGRRLTPDEVRLVLEPFAPFRGLTVFYILAGSRLGLI